MPTVTLSQRYTYGGMLYGPGPTDIANEDAAKALSAREAALKASAEPEKPAADSKPEPEATFKGKPLKYFDGKDREALIAINGIGPVLADEILAARAKRDTQK